MAIGVLFDMHLGGMLPPGAPSHVAGPTPRGWREVDVWESEQAFERFAHEQVLPLNRIGYAACGLSAHRADRAPCRALTSAR
jgi:hypothetical protein